ncbi:chromosome partitioning protein, ParB family [Butyrivibrio hungatei DSM 14810]|uniref:Chromosome partitioning protein, ParB family n=1 Tax=Butyrivibrio hungatei DSM 14810 TaxID=1121132 RepID=A0A1M7SR27_9FIRM|nr:ParB/RepB/Spo0J family partition protein [Butyrivibrio hungatei]SHN60828.1 chromosome partitioning protein, ParB family [Butyrivibrio hungatei DSM 14810]
MAVPKNAKRGLGKGLDSIIPAKVATTAKKPEAVTPPVDGQVVKLNITKIEPNRSQPRKTFDEDTLIELADSIKQFGIINPLIVTDKKDHYEIVGGERRWRAAKKAGLKEVPVIIKDLTEQEIAEIGLIDNIQREDINPIEEALAYKKLIDDFGYTQDVVADKVSKSRVTITNSLRLLKLCDHVRQMVIEGKISTGHARALISIENEEEQITLAQKVFDEKLSVRETEKLVKNLGKTSKPKKTVANKASLDAVYSSLSEKCKQAIGTKVEIISKGDGTGKIEIEFYSNDDLEKITDRLCKG